MKNTFLKKLIPLSTAMSLCLSMAACSKPNESSPAGSSESLNFIISLTSNDEHPINIVSYEFKKQMESLSDGRVQVDVYANGTLAGGDDSIEMCRNGTVTMASCTLNSLDIYEDAFGVFALPYLFHSWEDQTDYVHNSEKCQALWRELEKNTNLKFLGCTQNGVRCLSTTGVKQISSPADLSGIKVRSMESPVSQDTIRALGATPVPIAFSELYMALQTGVVNGQDNAIPVLYAGNYQEVTDYIYHTDHIYNTSTWVMNPDTYNAMSEEDRQTFDKLFQELYIDRYYELMADYEKIAEESVLAAGTKIIEQDELDIDAFYSSADAVVNENYLSDPVFGEYISDVRRTYNY